MPLVEVRPDEGLDTFLKPHMLNKGDPKGVTDGIERDVVMGRSNAPSGADVVESASESPDFFGEECSLIPDDHHFRQLRSEGTEPLHEEGDVRFLDAPLEQLITDDDHAD